MQNQPPTTGGRPRFQQRPQIQAEAPPPPLPQSTQPAPLVTRLPIRQQQQPPVPTLSPPIVPQPRLSATSSTALPPPQATVGLQGQQEARPLTSTFRMVEPPAPPPVQPSLTDINPSSPTPQPSPKARQLQPLTPPKPTAEPEPKPLMSPQPKSIIVQQKSVNGGGRTSLLTKQEDKGIALDARGPAKTAAATKEEAEKSFITLAGLNMGAYMELGHHHHNQKHHNWKQQVGQILNPVQESKPETEGRSGDTATKTKPRASLVNSNVQGINNSILFNTSCTATSPGIHVSLSNHRAEPGVLSPWSKEGGYYSNATSATNQRTKPHTAN